MALETPTTGQSGAQNEQLVNLATYIKSHSEVQEGFLDSLGLDENARKTLRPGLARIYPDRPNGRNVLIFINKDSQLAVVDLSKIVEEMSPKGINTRPDNPDLNFERYLANVDYQLRIPPLTEFFRLNRTDGE